MIEKKDNIQEIKAGVTHIPRRKKGEQFKFYGYGDFSLNNHIGHNMMVNFNIYYYRSNVSIQFSLFSAREQIKLARTVLYKVLSRIKYIRLELEYTTVEDSPRVMKFERCILLSDLEKVIYNARIDGYRGVNFLSPKNSILCDIMPTCDAKNILAKLYIGVIDL